MNEKKIYLSLKQIEFVDNVEDLLKEISSYILDFELYYCIKCYLVHCPINVRYEFYIFLSYCLQRSLNVDIIKMLKTKIEELEAKNYERN